MRNGSVVIISERMLMLFELKYFDYFIVAPPHTYISLLYQKCLSPCQCEDGFWSYRDGECTNEEFLRIRKYTEHAGYCVKHHHQAREVIVETLLACETAQP